MVETRIQVRPNSWMTKGMSRKKKGGCVRFEDCSAEQEEADNGHRKVKHEATSPVNTILSVVKRSREQR
jgi:hypothetical protein